ncbi:hypothetical protein F0562_026291 [Nyssa sinensis]|uniref:Uncharacterized protein n=1 Tax=Nyssa sinensis TaxID=561372 RepID=A0A5J5BAD0_9ASTE|nr:hypothetical protein F0562_026291 [Nyssa sinensis]
MLVHTLEKSADSSNLRNGWISTWHHGVLKFKKIWIKGDTETGMCSPAHWRKCRDFQSWRAATLLGCRIFQSWGAIAPPGYWILTPLGYRILTPPDCRILTHLGSRNFQNWKAMAPFGCGILASLDSWIFQNWEAMSSLNSTMAVF